MVVTDIAARGLDIEGVTHVFNYDIPHDTDSYIHRIGRTGRAGQTGTAVTFVVPGEQTYLRIIEQGIRASIKRQKSKDAKAAGEPQRSPAVAPGPKKPLAKKTAVHGGINLRSRRKPKTDEASAPPSRGAKGRPSRRGRA